MLVNKLLKRISDLEFEVERLHSIIKEAREYIEKNRLYDVNENCINEIILEILDKEK